MTEGQKYLIDACEEENVPRYIPSDFAVDYTKIPYGVLFPKESAKIIMEYLKLRKVKGAHILTGGLTETFWSQFFGIWNPKKCCMSVWGSGEEVWELTTYQTAAAYTAAVALDKSAVGVFRCKIFDPLLSCASHRMCFPLTRCSSGGPQELQGYPGNFWSGLRSSVTSRISWIHW